MTNASISDLKSDFGPRDSNVLDIVKKNLQDFSLEMKHCRKYMNIGRLPWACHPEGMCTWGARWQ